MDGRRVALNILMDVEVKGAFSNYGINKHLKTSINTREGNLIRELVYGVLENRIYIDYIISQASNRKIQKIHTRTLEILRLGVYQIVFMDRIPDRAAINEMVNFSKRGGHRGVSGFINAVLRNISRNKEDFKKVKEKDNANYLSIRYSHPLWMTRRWIRDYGYEFAKKLCEYNNLRPELNIRVNTIKVTREELTNRLYKLGYTVHQTKYARDGLIVEKPTGIINTEEFKLGYFFVQDESSMLAAQIANPGEDSVILDLCSAPGGKATHLGQIMNNKGLIISRDIHEHKLDLIQKNSDRLGIKIIRIEKFDASKLDTNLINKIDCCFLDAPCSGLGIIRRRPEIRWNRKPKDIKRLIEIQLKLLNNSKNYVKVGGTIIYSTCTIGREENVNIIKSFLHNNPKFRLMGFEDLICSNDNVNTSKEGYLELFPHIHNTDGFFIAKIQRIHE